MPSQYENQFSYKITNVSNILKKVGKRPRHKKIIMCHGNFDVVHPGHVRHLSYAKSKADYLVVSITADKFIKKGHYRPYIPENIRAQNLAAFQMVDFVVIDKNEKPLKNLLSLKPDYFAKGFEYTSDGLPPATKEEAKIVDSYGGEMIFTPGDIIYSSTQLLNLSEPNLDTFKILNLMSRNKIKFSDLSKSLKSLKNIKVHVIGDIIVDTYTKTNLIGGNTKTPTPSVIFQEKNDFVGGAGVVAKHLAEAGAKVTLTTVFGEDHLKDIVLANLKKDKIKVNPIVDSNRPTTNKNTITAGEYKMLKIDKLENLPISDKILKRIKNHILKEKCDIIIFSDFRHGIFNKKSINELNKSINNKTFKAADSQVATRWGDISEFKHFDLITPNEKEVRYSLSDQDSSISELTRELQKKSSCKNLILKLGSKGVVAIGLEKNKKISLGIPAFTKKVIDAVGAGDALLAYSSLSLYKTKSITISSILGSLAAACECEMEGNIAVKKDLISKKIKILEESSKYKSK